MGGRRLLTTFYFLAHWILQETFDVYWKTITSLKFVELYNLYVSHNTDSGVTNEHASGNENTYHFALCKLRDVKWWYNKMLSDKGPRRKEINLKQIKSLIESIITWQQTSFTKPLSAQFEIKKNKMWHLVYSLNWAFSIFSWVKRENLGCFI